MNNEIKNILVFEGEYLNNKRWNGKGKEDNKKFIFQGEYINVEKNGYIIQYDDNNRKLY